MQILKTEVTHDEDSTAIVYNVNVAVNNANGSTLTITSVNVTQYAECKAQYAVTHTGTTGQFAMDEEACVNVAEQVLNMHFVIDDNAHNSTNYTALKLEV